MKKAKQKPKSDGKDLTRAVTMRFMMAMGELIQMHKRTGGPCTNIKEFAISIQADPTVFSQYKNNTRNVTLEMCCMFCKVHGLDANLLLVDNGGKDTRMMKIEQRLNALEARAGIKSKKK